MLENLLRTKLFIPPLRPNRVPRLRLIERLNQGLHLGHKLTLISAPAGFGKTTLVGEWVGSLGLDAVKESQGSHAIAWLSLDESDNDLTRFLAYFIAALNQVGGLETPIGKGALGMLQTPQSPPADEALIALINDVAAIPAKITLILDDYHVIVSPPVDNALAFLLEHLPPQMHLVIATRDDPQLPLARLRARGQLTELRAVDLRFTLSEAAEFLNQVMGLDLEADDIASLETRTEGWIAGLQLAAVSIQGHKDATGLIKSFTGSHRFVLDYLIEEVLEQQSASVQTFLLKTAVLDRLTGSLCDVLTGQTNGQSTLGMLDNSNLFIIPLDGERQWYRYHHLFADLLRLRLRQNHLEQIPTLHRQASEWHEKNGFTAEAIEHALRAAEYERAACLIEEHVETFWGRGEHSKLRRWLDELPEEMLFSKPRISIFQARYYCNRGQLDAAERAIKAAEKALDGTTDGAPSTKPQEQIAFTHLDRLQLRGRAAATRALICSYQGDVPGIMYHARQSLEYLPKEDPTWRRVTALTLGNAHGFKGDMNAAYEARFEALKACEAAGDIYFTMIANLEVAITLREQGQLQRTIEICRQQMQFAAEFGLSQTRLVGWLLAVWGETLAELNDLNGALDRAQKGFRLTQRSGDLQMFGWSFICLIRILFSRADLADAEETIQKMENIARKSHLPPWITDQMAAWQARLWLAQDKLEAASQWGQERGLDTSGEPIPLQEIDYFSLFDYLILARILIAQGRLDETARLLEQLLKAAEAGGRTSKEIEIMILQALTFQAGGETDRALSALERALFLAEPEGFIRIFVDEGPPMLRLLYKAATCGMAADYVHQLLAAFPIAEPELNSLSKTRVTKSSWVEPLSERETEILQLVATGLTNREIASRLFLSLNTVKVHTRNIYGKLGINSRTQAVARARTLGILPST